MGLSTIVGSARLEVEGWLDTQSVDDEHADARAIHLNLLAVASRHNPGDQRPSLIERINEHAENVLLSATTVLTVLQRPDLTYVCRVPSNTDEPDDHLSGDFQTVHLVDPLAALRAIGDLRREAPNTQLAAMRLHESLCEQEEAVRGVAMAHLNAEDRPWAWLGSPSHKTVPPLQVGEGNLSARIKQLTAAQVEKLVSAGAERDLRKARRSVSALAGAAPAALSEICAEIGQMLQSVGYGWSPNALVVQHDIADSDCGVIARGYDNLARKLRLDASIKIKGKGAKGAITARHNVARCRRSLEVLAGWIRALGSKKLALRCHYCYRHRATKLRCHVHSVKTRITPDARRGAAVHPLYLEAFAALVHQPAERDALQASLQVNVEEQRGVEPAVRALGVPTELVFQASKLVVQLNRLRPALGVTLEGTKDSILTALCDLGAKAYRRTPGRTRDESKEQLDARDAIKALLTLRGFLIVWCATGRPFPRSLPCLEAYERDPAHPVTRNHSLAESEIAMGFLLERAWLEAEADLRRQNEIDYRDALKMIDGGMSYDAIAAHYGCNHGTIKDVLERGDVPRKRARLAGYSAKSRLRRP